MSPFSTSKKQLLWSTAIAFFLSSNVLAADLPTGGQIISGSGSISQSNNTVTIQQNSESMITNWRSFSIGQGNTVDFVQPSGSSVALNRVFGSDVSVIQGALNANGQVFLINPNGITFTKNAQVNVGGLVASTQDIATEDFIAGNYSFEGTNSNAIVNQGNIKAVNGGTIALIAAKIINKGVIKSESGNILMGAGNKVTLDLGGPVKIEVENGALDTLIEQGGAIRADGGVIYLTAKAAGDLATSVINHTGITEAQTLATGKKGEIILLGDMDVGVANIAGKLNAVAPSAGDGGFIETSAAHVKIDDTTRVTTASQNGNAGLWLIDPNDYKVAASGGDITGAALSANLSGGNVEIQTTGVGGNLYVNDDVSWSDNKLTLTANNNIIINNDLKATGTGSLAFQYGQDSADGAGNSYSIANGVQVLLPNAENFSWKKGNTSVTNNLWFGNGYLKFSQNQDAAINGDGSLLQPYYYDDGTSGRAQGWYALTFTKNGTPYPIDFAIGVGGDGENEWNSNGTVYATGVNFGITTYSWTPTPGNAVDIEDKKVSQVINIAGYKEGHGILSTKTTLDLSEVGAEVELNHEYSLGENDKFVKATSTVKNISVGIDLTNLRFWAGTRDDFIGQSDPTYKTKGNIVDDTFEKITQQDERAQIIKVTEQNDGAGAAVLFYSTSEKADAVTDVCCLFANITHKDPRTSSVETPKQDGSYGIFTRMADLVVGESESIDWYYGAGKADQLDNIINSVSQSANPSSTGSSSTTTSVAQNNAVASVQSGSKTQGSTTRKSVPYEPLESNGQQGSGSVKAGAGETLSIGSMEIVEISSANMGAQPSSNNGTNASSVDQTAEGDSTVIAGIGNQDELIGTTKVFVVDGGVRLPKYTEDEEE